MCEVIFNSQFCLIKSIKCPRATNLGGPIISLKANPNKNQLTVCWLSIDSSKLPIEHYEIIVNGEKKEKVKPLSGKHKVTLDGCVENIKYSILLVAIPKSINLIFFKSLKKF